MTTIIVIGGLAALRVWSVWTAKFYAKRGATQAPRWLRNMEQVRRDIANEPGEA